MSIEDLHFEMSKNWNPVSHNFIAMKVAFPLRMAVFYGVMAQTAKKMVQDELMAKVYSQPLPTDSSWGGQPSPRTGRTLLNVKASWSGMASRVFIDARGFPRYFYPYILEHGRQVSPKYYARFFFRDAMKKMEVFYFRAARIALKDFMFERGLV